jgi:hypothetical protein
MRVVSVHSAALVALLVVTIYMCIGVVSAYPKTLALSAFGTPGVQLTIDKLCFSWMLRWYHYPWWIIWGMSGSTVAIPGKGVFVTSSTVIVKPIHIGEPANMSNKVLHNNI